MEATTSDDGYSSASDAVEQMSDHHAARRWEIDNLLFRVENLGERMRGFRGEMPRHVTAQTPSTPAFGCNTRLGIRAGLPCARLCSLAALPPSPLPAPAGAFPPQLSPADPDFPLTASSDRLP